MTKTLSAVVGAVLAATAALLFLPSAAGSADRQPAAPAPTNGTIGPVVWRTVTVDYAGSGDRQQTMRITYRPGSTRSGWVMTIHGGSWVHGTAGDASMTRARQLFTGLGLAVVNINYRLSVTRGPLFAAQRADVARAFAYARRHASQYGLDPNRAVVYGHSAGGHLAAELGLAGNGHTGVRGIVTISAPLQPQNLIARPATVTSGNVYVYSWAVLGIGCPYSACQSRWAQYEPQTELSGQDPPILAFQGSRDTLVPSTMVDSFAALAARHGTAMTVVHDAAGHSDTQVYSSTARTAELRSFVEQRLGCRLGIC